MSASITAYSTAVAASSSRSSDTIHFMAVSFPQLGRESLMTRPLADQDNRDSWQSNHSTNHLWSNDERLFSIAFSCAIPPVRRRTRKFDTTRPCPGRQERGGTPCPGSLFSGRGTRCHACSSD